MKQETQTSLGAVVVAAGLSRRMGAFKPMLPLGDSTLIRSLLQRLRIAGADYIVLVVGREGDRLIQHVADLGVDWVGNPDFATTDMFRSVCIGLERIQGRCGRILFTPGDSPCFSPTSGVRLNQAMEQTGADILIPAYQGRRGHPILLANRVLPYLLTYRGTGGLRGALQMYPGPQQVLELEDPGLVLDADTPEDYQHLLAYQRRLESLSPERSPFSMNP